jgi:pimeloyl-ACP methyl ester carboxylesterase
MGHSYGGYLAYAYAQMIGNENLSGIITIGSSAFGGLKDNTSSRIRIINKMGIVIGNRVFVRPFGKTRFHLSKTTILLSIIMKYRGEEFIFSHRFYKDNTPDYIINEYLFSFDDEPAGVCIDITFGQNNNLYNGHWVDPQTLYDYSANLNKITAPLLAIAGSVDKEDPADDVNKTVENVSSIIKKFINIKDHAHADLLLSDKASILVYPEITKWLNTLI